MKSLGIIRRVDELGRIVLPIETRKLMGLETRDGVEIFVEDDRIVLKKYQLIAFFKCHLFGIIYNYAVLFVVNTDSDSCLEHQIYPGYRFAVKPVEAVVFIKDIELVIVIAENLGKDF